MPPSEQGASAARPGLTHHSLDGVGLAEVLELEIPLLAEKHVPHRQLSTIEKYVLAAGCRSVVIEHHYIDRDYIEDHSIFYASSLTDYPNYCRRIHFFTIDRNAAEAAFRGVRQAAYEQRRRGYTRACDRLSRKYLGFAVIKPLPGCPVGRTVLRACSRRKSVRYEFTCTRIYPVHVAGIELRVRGLAFQQQDLGVSACATTALWSALHQVAEFEAVALPTPAKITTLAARYSLPHGRAMPSEGLSLEQMCQAIQAVGVAPSLISAFDVNAARAYLYAACRSGFASVLIIEDGNGSRHAVTTTGLMVQRNRPLREIEPGFIDKSQEMVGLYVHDDRIGPYLEAEFVVWPEDGPDTEVEALNVAPPSSVPTAGLRDAVLGEHATPSAARPAIRLGPPGAEPETWLLTHILVPVHQKIRLSFIALIDIAQELVIETQIERLIRTGIDASTSPEEDCGVVYEVQIVRSDRYFMEILLGDQRLEPRLIEQLTSAVPSFSRYIAVVMLRAAFLDCIHVIIDSTGTSRNVNPLAVVITTRHQPDTIHVATWIAHFLACPLVA